MARFVLVHGIWAGGWVWSDVAPLLRTAGHEVHTPTLTGVGERVHLAHPDIDLDTHIHDLVNVLFYRDLQDVILVGWSYGGMPITGAADRTPERLEHLVYIDAPIPFDGESRWDLRTPQENEFWSDLVREHGDGWRAPHFLGDDDLAHVIEDEAKRHWCLARSEGQAQPLKTMTQPVRLSNPAAETLPRTFISCTVDAADGDRRMAERARSTPGWRYRELSATHFAVLTHPQEVVNLLLEVA